jgi:hypothetical protein
MDEVKDDRKLKMISLNISPAKKPSPPSTEGDEDMHDV